jgi:hypothetical protein
MSSMLPGVTALSQSPALPALCFSAPPECPICKSRKLQHLGEKDFGVSCNDFFLQARTYPDYGAPVPYLRCNECAFAFTPGFDNWTDGQMKDHIYNDQYVLSDPPFEDIRPRANAHMLAQIFLRDAERLTFLDYGAGLGLTARALGKEGFRTSAYDPFFEHSEKPAGRFDIILAFEVIEHVRHADQLEWLKSLTRLLSEGQDSRILLSTDVDAHNDLSRWYMSPRNGHVSLHSPGSLRLLAGQAGLQCLSLSSSLHVLTRAGALPG